MYVCVCVCATVCVCMCMHLYVVYIALARTPPGYLLEIILCIDLVCYGLYGSTAHPHGVIRTFVFV